MFEALSNLKNLGSMIKQAQEMSGKLQEINDQLKEKRVTGSSGGGMVQVEVNGAGEVLRCQIDPVLVTDQKGKGGDREMIEDLLPAAVNQALAKARELHAEAMRQVTGGMNLPGLEDVLGTISGGTKE